MLHQSAPIFGYLGDRYSRKFLVGRRSNQQNSAVTLLLSAGYDTLGLLLLRLQLHAELLVLPGGQGHAQCRKVTPGVSSLQSNILIPGESSFSVIAPTIIGDLFTAEQRSLAYGLFYVAIPFGTGLGFGVGGFPSHWRWGLRVTPILSYCFIPFVVLFLSDPTRGESDGAVSENKSFGCAGIVKDLKYIAREVLIW